MGRRTRKYWCEDCKEHHEVDVQPKPRHGGKRGWKVVSKVVAGDDTMFVDNFVNPRTHEVMKVNSVVTERFILRSGPNKGRPIFRTQMTVVRG